MLYLVATPIGNLSDITLRALEVLREVDVILCEDTRHSSRLLTHYEIKKPLISFHAFNEASKQERIAEEIRAGKKIALISDAGTPLISDPGESLVKHLAKEGLEVVPIPGPSSVIAALSGSGLPTSSFQFLGFMPRTLTEKNQSIAKSALFEGTTLFFESPERIIDTVEMIAERGPEWDLVIAREITKKHEEFLRGKPHEILGLLKERKILGEIVLLIHTGVDPLQKEIEEMSAKDLVEHLTTTFEIPLKEAIKIAASLKGLPKQSVYKNFH